jgi:uncharacterized protein YggE
MKKITLLAAAIFALAAMPVMAQAPAEPATLTAEGTGIVLAAPDIVMITIGVTTRGDNPAAALDASSADMRSVIDSILAAGVPESDIVTSNFSINPIYANRQQGDNQPLRIIGYSVSNQLTVRIDIDASGAVLNQVVAAGANQISGIRFDIAEPQPLQDEATAAAIVDARRRAELMASAAGVRLVRVLSVSAYANSNSQVQFLARAEAAVPIMGGEQAITANATLVFEIAPQ